MKILPVFFLVIVFSNSLFSQSMSKDELAFVNEINLVRTQPKLYAKYIREYYQHTNFDSDEEKQIVQQELLPLLDTLSPLPALIASDKLRKILQTHTGIRYAEKTVDHDEGIIDRYPGIALICENIVYTSINTYRANVISLLVDEGIPDRGHRKNILNATVTLTAVRKVEFSDKDKPSQKDVYWIEEFVKYF